jgi:hypothetical protein
MTSLLDATSSSAKDPTRSHDARRLPTAPRSKRPLVAAASAALVFVSIAAFATVYSSATRRSPALIVTSTIEQGQAITAADLGQANVSVSNGVVPFPTTDAGDLAGKRAAVTIPAGSLLTAGDVTASPQVATGDAVVGVALKAGQLPAAGVEPGDQVMIIETGSPGTAVSGLTSTGSSAGPSAGATGTPETGILVPQASVFGTASPASDSSGATALLVSVEVSTTLAAAVSTAAAADQVSLVLLPRGTSDPAGQSAGSAS